MPTIILRDFIYDDFGLGVGSIRVRAYAKTGINTRAATHVTGAEVFTSAGDGMWSLTLDTSASPTGLFTIQYYNSATGQVRWRDGHVRLQVEAIIGTANAAPIPDGSVTAAKIIDGGVTAAKIIDGALPSTKLPASERTVDQAIATATANTGTLGQLFSWIGKQIKAITGNADWKTAPATNLSTAHAHITNVALHGGGVVSAAPLTTGYVQGTSISKVAAGTVNVTISGNTGSFYVNTLMNGIITIILTDGNAGTTANAIAVSGYETTFPDTTNLFSFRVYPSVADGTSMRVNFLIYYW